MRFAVLTSMLAAFVLAAPARADVIENFEVEDWGGLAYADDTTGEIANCAVFASNQKGATLLFIRNSNDSWYFSLSDDEWQLDVNSDYPVRYKIDGRRTVEGDATALSDTQLAILLADDAPFLGQVRRGNRLTFTFQDESYEFDLSDSGDALDAALECVERHKESGTEVAQADEAESEPEAEAAPEEEAAQPEEQAASDDQDAGAEAAEGTTETVDTGAETDSGGSPAGPQLPPFGNTEIETMDVPGWEAAAYADDSGAFTHCAIRAEYQNGTVLAFARTADGSLVMALAREDWTGELGAWVPIEYEYNGGDLPLSVTGEAQLLQANLIAVNMGRDDAFNGQLKTAPEIAVRVDGQNLTFDISDVGPGIEAIDECRERHGAAAPSAKVQSSSKKVSSAKVAKAAPAPAEEPGPDEAAAPDANTDAEAPDTKAEATDFTTALLARAGYEDHAMLTGDDVPESMRNRASAWQIGEIMGVTDIVGGTVAEIRGQLEASDRKDCSGAFQHEAASDDGDDGAHVFTSCKDANLDLNIHYVILPRSPEGYFLLSFIAFQEGSAAAAIAEKVYSAGRES